MQVKAPHKYDTLWIQAPMLATSLKIGTSAYYPNLTVLKYMYFLLLVLGNRHTPLIFIFMDWAATVLGFSSHLNKIQVKVTGINLINTSRYSMLCCHLVAYLCWSSRWFYFCSCSHVCHHVDVPYPLSGCDQFCEVHPGFECIRFCNKHMHLKPALHLWRVINFVTNCVFIMQI